MPEIKTQYERKVATRLEKAPPNHQDFEQVCGLIQTHVNLGHWIMTVF